MLPVSRLGGFGILLEPLVEPYRELLRAAADDPRIWEFTLARGDGAGFDPWFDAALAETAAGRRFAFAVRRADGEVLGSTSYLDLGTGHPRLEIGSTWYHPAVWDTAVNPACKLLLLAHAFETLGCAVVGLRTDNFNFRSQRAIEALGAKKDGVLRHHQARRDGTARDSVMYSVLAGEWKDVKRYLEMRISR